MMQYKKDQVLQNMVSGWTRIDMLIALYDRTISTLKMAKHAQEGGSEKRLSNQIVIEINKLMLGLHSGLNTEKFPVAINVARLLNFIMLRIEEQNYDEAIHFLGKLRTSFSKIREEANQLESAGEIPPIASAAMLDTLA